jgi:tetratricopeptide (TPR) repeat protein
MPTWRSPDLILEETHVPEPQRMLFWRILSDYRFWWDSRGPLFWAYGIGMWRSVYPAEISPALHTLEKIWVSPHLVEDSRLAEACAVVWEWAERKEYLEIAMQFAELAARLEPLVPGRASTAGRIARRQRTIPRGSMWFTRAYRLARLQKKEIDFAIAHLGMGALELEIGNPEKARRHAGKAFKAAMRRGRRSLAACASHDIMAAYISEENYEDAGGHAQSAVAMYDLDHPRFPGLAHDVAVLWSRLGYYSSALTIFEIVLPAMVRLEDHITALANIARAAAACGDRVRYQRALKEVIEAINSKAPIRPSSIYHLAWAARTYQDWPLATQLAKICVARYPESQKSRARTLLEAIQSRLPGDTDKLPEVGSELEEARQTLLKKLRKHAASGDDPEATPPPERYPLG